VPAGTLRPAAAASARTTGVRAAPRPASARTSTPAGGRVRVVDDQCRAVLLARHHRPLEAAVRTTDGSLELTFDWLATRTHVRMGTGADGRTP
jgi:hypothetical protein